MSPVVSRELPTYQDTDGGWLVESPSDWPYLRKQSGVHLTEHYMKSLVALDAPIRPRRALG